MPKTNEELEKDLNNMGEKFSNAIFGNGKRGLLTEVVLIKWQIGIIILMNAAIIGMLVKLIFFKGV